MGGQLGQPILVVVIAMAVVGAMVQPVGAQFTTDEDNSAVFTASSQVTNTEIAENDTATDNTTETGNVSTQAEPDSGINSMEIIDKVDRDGDGKASAFTIRADVDTQCFGCHDSGGLIGTEKMEPKLEVEINGESIKWTEELDRDDSLIKDIEVEQSELQDKFGAQDLTVTLELYDDDPAINDLIDGESTTVSFEPSDEDQPNRQPDADAGNNKEVTEDDNIELDGTGSFDPDDDPLSYTWTQTSGPAVGLDDADTATPSFTAPSVEEKTTLEFELTVSDGNGGSSTDSVTVTVFPEGNQAPSASFKLTPASPSVNQTITFDASGSSDPDGDITRYEWDLDDDGEIEQTGTSITHVFNTSGSQTVVLTVVDGSGANDSVEQTFTVEPETATATAENFSLSVTGATGTPNATTTIDTIFTNTRERELSGPAVKIPEMPTNWTIADHTDAGATYSTDEGNPTWLWLQVSGNTSKTPTITFAIPNSTDPGKYTITVEAVVPDGTTVNTTATVTVKESKAKTVEQIIAGSDGTIDITEIQQAIQYWANGEPVPNTGGKTIGITKIQQLIQIWASGGTVGSS